MNLNEMCKEIHTVALQHGFWESENKTPIKLMLVITELSEACEADRIGDHNQLREEIADAVIRICDLAGYLNIDLEYEINRKMEINAKREHLHGKKY